jgi:YHS domain-containing protein
MRATLVTRSIVLFALAFVIACGGEQQAATDDTKTAVRATVEESEIGTPFICAVSFKVESVDEHTIAYSYDGEKYYMCESCGPKFEADPGAAVARITPVDHEIAKEELNTEQTCPVSGVAIVVTEQTPAVDFAGKTHFFRCPGSKAAFVNDPISFMQGLVQDPCGGCEHRDEHS